MKVKEVIGALEEFAPLALQDGYDNAGLQIGLAEEAEATGALLCLDVTEDAVVEALRRGCNIIVSHHPLLFRPLKSVTERDYVGRTVVKAIKAGISIYAAHTNLDSAFGGVSFKMAEKLGLQDVEWLSPKCEYRRGGETLMAGEGVIGTLPVPMSPKGLMDKVKETFMLSTLRVNDFRRRNVSRVALCGGSGAFLIPRALERGADVFITGEIGYHRFFGLENSLLLMEMGHYESEQFTLEILHDVLTGVTNELPVYAAKTKTNPIKNI